MKLVLLSQLCLVEPGLFTTPEAARVWLRRHGRKGEHWFQERRRAPWRVDVDAIKTTLSGQEPPPLDALPLARGGWLV